MRLQEVIGDKKIAIFGLGKSGQGAVKFLSENEIPILIWDENKENLLKLKEKYKTNKLVEVANYKDYNWSNIAYLILSAGVPLTHPTPHEIVKIAKKYNCPIVSDVEILYKSYPDNTFIGITGTNGKSTTTALLGHIFKSVKVKSDFGGNLGNKASLELERFEKDGVYIIEMSSYMLDLTRETKFNFAILINITPDHYERHGNLAGYMKAKKKIFLNQDKNCFAIINIDDENSKKVYDELKKNENYKGNLVPVSVNKIIKNGFSLVSGEIHNHFQKHNEDFILGDLSYLKGQHNAENIICAFVVSYLYGLNPKETIDHIKKFEGLSHRMQFVRKINNINFINDSNATNDTSTEQALMANDNIFWILGGRTKPNGITILKKYFDKIIYAFLIGEATEEFAKTLEKGKVKYFKCETLEKAFKKAYELAQQMPKEKEVNILLSPVCSSFDQWANFEKRGEYFVKLTKEIKA